MGGAEPIVTLSRRVHADVDAVVGAVRDKVRQRFPELFEPPVRMDQVLEPLVALLVDVDGDPTHGTATAVIATRCREQARAMAAAERPRQMLLEGYEYAISVIIGQLWQRGRAGDYADLTDRTGRASAVLGTFQDSIAEGYWLQARADRSGRRGVEELAHALMSGRATPEQAGRIGLVLAERYRAAVLRSRDASGEWRAAVSERLHAGNVPHCVLPDEVVLFEPEDSCMTPGTMAGCPDLGRTAIGTATDAVPALPEAVSRARTLAELALGVPVLGRIVSESDLPLELVLLQDERLTDGLRALVGPVAGRPELLSTIRVLYEVDANRTRAARRLGIARQTLAARLARIEQLTGLDPTSSRGTQILFTALTALSLPKPAGGRAGAPIGAGDVA